MKTHYIADNLAKNSTPLVAPDDTHESASEINYDQLLQRGRTLRALAVAQMFSEIFGTSSRHLKRSVGRNRFTAVGDSANFRPNPACA